MFLFVSVSLSLPFWLRKEERDGERERERSTGRKKGEKLTLFFIKKKNWKKSLSKQAATDLKAANFWAGSDALAKYLLIGYPKNIGISVPEVAPNAFNQQSYESPNFAGLKEYR